MDGSMRAVIVHSNLDKPRDVVLDPERGYVCYGIHILYTVILLLYFIYGYITVIFYIWLCYSYILYITRPKKHFKMNKEVGMLLPKKELIQVE